MSPPTPTITHPPLAVRRGAARATTWWGKAWVRAIEEAAYDDADLRRARSLSRSGDVGAITWSVGGLVASVTQGSGVVTAAIRLSTLDDAETATLVEAVAAVAGRVAALLAGDLPHELVEHADEAGVELLPFGGELEASCTCEAWLDPCVHALGVLYQAAWLLDGDPLLLLHLRGLPRDDLLARVHAVAARPEAPPPDDLALETAVDAALRAARLLELLDDPAAPTEHLY